MVSALGGLACNPGMKVQDKYYIRWKWYDNSSYICCFEILYRNIFYVRLSILNNFIEAKPFTNVDMETLSQHLLYGPSIEGCN